MRRLLTFCAYSATSIGLSVCIGSGSLEVAKGKADPLTPGVSTTATSQAVVQGMYSSGGLDIRHVSKVYNGYIFLSTNSAALQVVNLNTDPLAPVLSTTINQAGESIRSFSGATNYIFSAGGTAKRLYISDISNLPSYTAVAGLLHNNTATEIVLDAFVSGNFLYTGTGNDSINSSLTIWNITTPALATGVSAFQTTQPVRQVLVSGNYAFLAESANGLHVVNVTNKSAPVHTAYVTGIGSAATAAAYASYVYVGSSSGLHVIDVSNPTVPVLRTTLNVGSVLDVSVAGSSLYVSLGASGFKKYSLSNPMIPGLVVSYSDGLIYKSCQEYNGFIYAAAGTSGLRVLDIVTGGAKVVTPVFSQPGGTFSSAFNLTISSATAGAKIYYTTDGSDPSVSGTRILYSAPLNVSTAQTIKAYAIKAGFANSDVVSNSYYTYVADPQFSVNNSLTYNTQLTLGLSCGTFGATIRYTLDGSDPQSSGTALTYTAGNYITLNSTTTIRAYAYNGPSTSLTVSKTYTFSGGTTIYLNSTAGNWTRIAVDPSDGKPLVVYQDITGAPYATRVKKWVSGSTWTDLGAVSTGQTYNANILIDKSDNKPIVTFSDLDNNYRTRAKKWTSGTSWSDLGMASAGITSYVVSAMRTDNRPVVMFRDNDDGMKQKIYLWAGGTSWSYLGTPMSNAEKSAIAINSSNTMYLVIADGTNLQSYYGNGGAWTSMGNVNTGSVFGSGIISLAINPTDGYPVAYYTAYSGGESGPVVRKWNGSSWIRLGTDTINGGNAGNIVVDSTGRPYITYMDSTIYTPKISRWNGSTWDDLGYFGSQANEFGNIALDGSNRVFLVKDAPFSISPFTVLRYP